MPKNRPTTEAYDDVGYFKDAVGIAKVEVPEVILPRDRHMIVENMRLHYLEHAAAAGNGMVTK